MGMPVPSAQRVVDEFGDDAAAELVPAVLAPRDEFHRSEVHLECNERWQEMRERSSQEFRSRHPEISDEAVDALAWHYIHTYK